MERVCRVKHGLDAVEKFNTKNKGNSKKEECHNLKTNMPERDSDSSDTSESCTDEFFGNINSLKSSGEKVQLNCCLQKFY